MKTTKPHYLLTFIVLCFISNFSVAQTKIIKSNDQWLYYDNGSLPFNWYLSDTKGWKEGVTPIGYGDKKISTSISFGTNKDHKDIVKYFKKSIILENPTDFLAYEIKVKRDDGILIYLNNKEIYRDNLPNGLISGETSALYRISGSGESVSQSTIIDSRNFKPGKNTIAVSVHQVDAKSSDCIFDLELIGHDNAKVLSLLLDQKSVLNNQLENQISNLQIKNTSIQIDMLKQSNDNLKFTLFVIIFLLTSSIVVGYTFIKNHKKHNEELNKKMLAMNDEVLEKNKELMLLSNQILHHKQYFKEVILNLKSYKGSIDATSVKAIIKDINATIYDDGEWDNLQKHFNILYDGFYDKVITLHPTLTETELRHCMFIKLHLQTKEIARIMLVDPRSVQTARYRIKKKMNLDENTDLRVYLLSIL